MNGGAAEVCLGKSEQRALFAHAQGLSTGFVLRLQHLLYVAQGRPCLRVLRPRFGALLPVMSQDEEALLKSTISAARAQWGRGSPPQASLQPGQVHSEH